MDNYLRVSMSTSAGAVMVTRRSSAIGAEKEPESGGIGVGIRWFGASKVGEIVFVFRDWERFMLAARCCCSCLGLGALFDLRASESRWSCETVAFVFHTHGWLEKTSKERFRLTLWHNLPRASTFPSNKSNDYKK
ncbi:hypothetical protein Droror1_Dr00009987 [Drosera rotundifolia]